MKYSQMFFKLFLLYFFHSVLFSEIIPVGSGSYTTIFPGYDEAGRNSYPDGTPQISGPALSKKIPTNDWWSKVIQNDHADNLFNYPLALKTINQGLVASYIPWGVYDDQEPIIVGVSNLNAAQTNVFDFSDWTVTLEWASGNSFFRTTSGIGMPFIYFEKNSECLARITVNLGNVEVQNEKIIIEDARNGADFIIYAPIGSQWNQNGSVYTSELNGNNYWSMVMVPQGEMNLSEIASDFSQYAYVFPQNTQVNWNYDEYNATLQTEFEIEVEVKEGSYNNILQGLLPHQWNNLSSDSPSPGGPSYESVRGELKTLGGNYFKTEYKFNGILPTLPALAHYSPGYNPGELQDKILQIQNDELPLWTDSYNEGQLMNRLIQTGRIAAEIGNENAKDLILETIQNRLEDWLSASSNEVAFLFYYNDTWSTLIGYPAGHGQDYNVNDHHFHWGYFIHAASFVEQFNPGWSNQWGDMVNYLIRDAASSDREDSLFPFLRSFSPFAGHCWANGFATFPQGNDQESSSESMQFNSSLIHWGSVTNNDEIRDLGIYLYTTEKTAIDEYWFDMYNRNFASDYPYSLVSRVWGNSYDNGTFWTNDIAASYGIEMYPIHGGSFYLSHNLDYVSSLWNEITNNTGILNNEINPNLWHDVFWKYLSFINPSLAIQLHDSFPERSLKFGISDAQTYYWIHNMNALGNVRSDVTSDHPIALSFIKDGQPTYIAHNYSNNPLSVTFSDGFELFIEPRSMGTNRGSDITGEISSEFYQAYMNGSIQLDVTSEIQNITRVEFFNGPELLGEDISFPYSFLASNLPVGMHDFYGKIYSGLDFGLTNIINIQVGEQLPYEESVVNIPGTIEPGKFDFFQGGVGQNISYFDNTISNNGSYRLDEYVDVEYFGETEGPTLGWIESGEWVEYTIHVEEPGFYDLAYRFASDLPSGGGPFYLELNGVQISNNLYAVNTGDWYNWSSELISDIILNAGQHILRLVFSDGGFNLGRLTFTYNRELDFSPPFANAGEDIIVLSPASSTTLDGSLSYDNDSDILNYFWEQIYGPIGVSFSDEYSVQTEISDLVEGVYKFKLNVNDGNYSSIDHVLVFVSETSDFAPFVNLNTSLLNNTYYFGTPIEIHATASDLDGFISMVEFFGDENLLGTDEDEPFSFIWDNVTVGYHTIYVNAIDNGGLVSSSESFSFEVLEAPECTGGPDNGHYTYRFSDDLNDPTLTFIPSASHVGNPTCILYYSTSGIPPGYYVTPNVPYTINASEGEVIQFYYTYSYNGMEANTSDDPHTYEIGSCNESNLAILETDIPSTFLLYDNYPNPFNPTTQIHYGIPSNQLVRIAIFDVRGRHIRNLVNNKQSAGYYSVQWNARDNEGKNAPAGMYFYVFEAGKFRSTKKMVLLK